MRILLVHNYYQQPGGEDQVFSAESSMLKKHGCRAYRYTVHNDRIKGMNPLMLAGNTLWNKAIASELRETVRKVRPDVVHFHNTFPLISPAAYYVAKAEGIPVVQTLHNYRLLCPNAEFFYNNSVCEGCLGKAVPWPGALKGCYRDSRAQTAVVAMMLTFHRMLKTWQKKVDIYIALTDFARNKFIEGGLPAEKIVVKPNFVYPDPGPKDSVGSYALFIGRLSPEKGIGTLLEAWKRLQGIPLKLVGDGPLMGEIRKSVEKEGLTCIETLGHCPQKDVLSLIKGARFLIFPSEWYETFGRVAIEAFACGVPVIASNLGAMAEIVEDGRTGLHFETGNSEDLAAKVEWAWTHEKEMLDMGRDAREEYEEKYTAERNYEMLMEIYKKVTNTRKGGITGTDNEYT